MGLDYLNKKVWHPGSIKNIEKVWEVEQVQHEINKKNKERAKKLVEERHNEDLKRIQVEAGLIPRSHLDRMDWMYDWGNKIQQQQKNSEDYLLGKKAPKKDNKGIFQEQVTNKNCEDFSMIHQDPLYAIQRQEKARRDALLSNPIEMRNIIREVEKEYLPTDLNQRRGQKLRQAHKVRHRDVSQERGDRGQQKHERRHRRHHKTSRRSTSSDSSRSKSSSRSRSRSRSRQKQRQKQRQRSRERRSRKQLSNRKSETGKETFHQSQAYKEYLRERFGPILKKDDDGNLKPDYSAHKPKYRTQMQLQNDERLRRIQELRDNALKLKEMRQSQSNRHSQRDESTPNEQGIARIRQHMMASVKDNRNHLKLGEIDT